MEATWHDKGCVGREGRTRVHIAHEVHATLAGIYIHRMSEMQGTEDKRVVPRCGTCGEESVPEVPASTVRSQRSKLVPGLIASGRGISAQDSEMSMSLKDRSLALFRVRMLASILKTALCVRSNDYVRSLEGCPGLRLAPRNFSGLQLRCHCCSGIVVAFWPSCSWRWCLCFQDLFCCFLNWKPPKQCGCPDSCFP